MTSSSGAHSLEPDQPPLCIKDLYKYARIIQSSQPKKPAEVSQICHKYYHQMRVGCGVVIP